MQTLEKTKTEQKFNYWDYAEKFTEKTGRMPILEMPCVVGGYIYASDCFNVVRYPKADNLQYLTTKNGQDTEKLKNTFNSLDKSYYQKITGEKLYFNKKELTAYIKQVMGRKKKGYNITFSSDKVKVYDPLMLEENRTGAILQAMPSAGKYPKNYIISFNAEFFKRALKYTPSKNDYVVLDFIKVNNIYTFLVDNYCVIVPLKDTKNPFNDGDNVINSVQVKEEKMNTKTKNTTIKKKEQKVANIEGVEIMKDIKKRTNGLKNTLADYTIKELKSAKIQTTEKRKSTPGVKYKEARYANATSDYKITKKQAGEILKQYKNARYNSIQQCFDKCSDNKKMVEGLLIKKMAQDGGYDYRILSANSFQFFAGYMLDKNTLAYYNGHRKGVIAYINIAEVV